jgi:hypothetical protein
MFSVMPSDSVIILLHTDVDEAFTEPNHFGRVKHPCAFKVPRQYLCPPQAEYLPQVSLSNRTRGACPRAVASLLVERRELDYIKADVLAFLEISVDGGEDLEMGEEVLHESAGRDVDIVAVRQVDHFGQFLFGEEGE